MAFRNPSSPNRALFASTYAQNTVGWAISVLEMSTDEIASAVGASRRTIHRWQSAQTPPSPEHRKRLETLQEFRYLLAESFRTPAAAIEWLHTPVPALRGRTPHYVLVRGEGDQLVTLLASLQAGAFV